MQRKNCNIIRNLSLICSCICRRNPSRGFLLLSSAFLFRNKLTQRGTKTEITYRSSNRGKISFKYIERFIVGKEEGDSREEDNMAAVRYRVPAEVAWASLPIHPLGHCAIATTTTTERCNTCVVAKFPTLSTGHNHVVGHPI